MGLSSNLSAIAHRAKTGLKTKMTPGKRSVIPSDESNVVYFDNLSNAKYVNTKSCIVKITCDEMTKLITQVENNMKNIPKNALDKLKENLNKIDGNEQTINFLVHTEYKKFLEAIKNSKIEFNPTINVTYNVAKSIAGGEAEQDVEGHIISMNIKQKLFRFRKIASTKNDRYYEEFIDKLCVIGASTPSSTISKSKKLECPSTNASGNSLISGNTLGVTSV